MQPAKLINAKTLQSPKASRPAASRDVIAARADDNHEDKTVE